MKRYRGTECGPRGVYLNLTTREFINLGGAGVLPGNDQVKYRRVPPVMALVLGPFTGLAFIIFLPFAGMAAVTGFLGYKVWRGILALERKTLAAVAVTRGGTRKTAAKDDWKIPGRR